MRRLRLAHTPLIVGAIGRWLVGSRTGRKVFVVGLGLGAATAMLTGTREPSRRREGTWSGLHNEYAPNKGQFTVEAATCTFRGRAGFVSGNGWVFKGSLSVDEVACNGGIGKDGRVSARLTFKERWDGQVKGIGGDWDDRSGTALCTGEVEGTLAGGGTWKGTCRTDEGKTYPSSFVWSLRGE